MKAGKLSAMNKKTGFKRKFFLGLISILTFTLQIQAQPGVENQKNWSLRGYVKLMQTFNIADGFDSLLVDNLIHNRLMFRYYPTDEWMVRVDMRNRILYGDFVQLIPQYDQLIDIDNNYLDLSFFPVNKSDLIFHSVFDRAFVRWRKNKWEITLGRQRINWGINLAWNPNDIFNAYNFFDFDYEERPGSDALRVQYYTGFASSLQFAVNAADNWDELVAAGLWKINQWNYDFQFLGGISRGDIVLGSGWAGNIEDAGFKGEISYFRPYDQFFDETKDEALVGAVAFDYSFENSLYLYGSYMYNSGQPADPDFSLLNFSSSEQLSAKNLLPFKHTLLLQGMYTFSPLVNGSLATIYFPGNNGVFLNPGLTISLFQNWDLDLIGQIYFSDMTGEYKAIQKFAYLRLKYSF